MNKLSVSTLTKVRAAQRQFATCIDTIHDWETWKNLVIWRAAILAFSFF